MILSRPRPRLGNLTGVVAWYDSSQETAAHGTVLTQITDRSGNARHLTVTGNITLSKTGGPSGRSCYKGDSAGSAYARGAFGITVPQPYTIVAVANFPDAGTAYLFDGIASGNRCYTQGGKQYNGVNVNSLAPIPSGYRVWRVLADGPRSRTVADNLPVCSGDAGTHALTGLTMFANFNNAAGVFHNGGIAELVVINHELTLAETRKIREAMA